MIKDILFRAAERTRVRVTLVANQWLRTPPSRFIDAIQVPGGFDVADTAIVERVRAGDLVVTQDIPLAARVIERGAAALNPRGERYTADNMAERLSMRDFMEELRGAGVQTGGPAALHARDRQAFANQLDRWLAARPAANWRRVRPTPVPGALLQPRTMRATTYRGSSLAKPNYSFEKRQREIAKKKKQDEKDARKREAREAARAAKANAAAGQPDEA